MRRILLITNPAAARTRRRTTDAVVAVLEREGCDVDVAVTTGPGDAVTIARQAVNGHLDALAVYGGDGTVMQAVAGIAGHDVPIGLIPGGTGNLLARNLRLPRDPIAAAHAVARGRPRRIDLGSIERPSGTRYFAVACGSGFDADLMATTSREAKQRWGFAAYLVRGWNLAREAPTSSFTVTVDGDRFEAVASVVLVANCPEFPFVHLPPGISLEDGHLDAVLLTAHGLADALHVMWKLWRGAEGAHARYVRGRVISVDASPPRAMQMDGEVDGETPFTATVLQRGLSVLVPSPSG